jgi:hypothetical protein
MMGIGLGQALIRMPQDFTDNYDYWFEMYNFYHASCSPTLVGGLLSCVFIIYF